MDVTDEVGVLLLLATIVVAVICLVDRDVDD
jgi:hypothetical protein